MAAVSAVSALVSTYIGVQNYATAKSAAKTTRKAEKARVAALEAERIAKEEAEAKARVRGKTAGANKTGVFSRSAFLSTLGSGVSGGSSSAATASATTNATNATTTGFTNEDTGIKRSSVFGN